LSSLILLVVYADRAALGLLLLLSMCSSLVICFWTEFIRAVSGLSSSELSLSFEPQPHYLRQSQTLLLYGSLYSWNFSVHEGFASSLMCVV
jgi:hypothetical protein